LEPAFDKGWLKRLISRNVPLATAEYVHTGGRRLSSKEVAKAWLEYTIETQELLEHKAPSAEQVQELRKLAEKQPDEFIKMILGQ
jgi:hypothetical protein